ncbi:MAG TPA: hypothetical protein VL357_09720 [Rariglobus sp.]|nr:hypothetical protein [Rariglobus sp.]
MRHNIPFTRNARIKSRSQSAPPKSALANVSCDLLRSAPPALGSSPSALTFPSLLSAVRTSRLFANSRSSPALVNRCPLFPPEPRPPGPVSPAELPPALSSSLSALTSPPDTSAIRNAVL